MARRRPPAARSATPGDAFSHAPGVYPSVFSQGERTLPRRSLQPYHEDWRNPVPSGIAAPAVHSERSIQNYQSRGADASRSPHMAPRTMDHSALMGQERPSYAPPGDFSARPPPCPPRN
eukprot:6542271-Heterocapsa_arctica.AAC.1